MTSAPQKQDQKSDRTTLVICAALMLGMMVSAVSQMIIGTALPTIVGELGGLSQLPWVITITLLSSTCATPLIGKLGDLYGRKRVFVISLGAFTLATTLAGLSQTMTQLIVLRAAQGIAGGGLMALSQATIADVVAPRERGRYQGYMMSMWAVVSVGGPLIGGLLVDHLNWRWCFYVVVPFSLVALAVIHRTLHVPHEQRAHKVDYVGSALLVMTVSAILLITTWGGTRYPWTSRPTALLVSMAVSGLVLFVIQENRAAEPVLPLRLFRTRTFCVTSAAGFMQGMCMFGVMTFMPIYLQVVIGLTATQSGLQFLPLMGGTALASTWSGRRIARTGRYRRFPVAGMAVVLIALIMLTLLDRTSSPVEALAPLVVMGIGLGLTMHVMTLAAQNSAAKRDLGVATSSAMFFRLMGGAIGTAVFGAVFNSELLSQVASRRSDVAELDLATLARSPLEIQALPPTVREPIVEAFAAALQQVFVVAVPIAALALVLILMLREEPLRDGDEALENGEAGPSPEDGALFDEYLRDKVTLPVADTRSRPG